jgi:hypothetical protein
MTAKKNSGIKSYVQGSKQTKTPKPKSLTPKTKTGSKNLGVKGKVGPY